MARVTTDLNAAVMRILQEYAGDAEAAVTETITAVTKQAAKRLRATSPARKKGGVYAKSWQSKVEKSRNMAAGVVYNSKKPGLAHLLEHGHGPGKRGWRVAAKRHIAPVADWAEAEAVKKLVSKL